MPSRDINLLKPELLEKYKLFEAEMKKEGLGFIVTNTAREYKEQFALFAQGREPLGSVNNYRKLAGLAPIDEKQNARKVTWTLRSKHIINLDDNDSSNDFAEAFDIALYINGKISWDVKADIDEDGIPNYTEAGIIGERVGLVWGGRFKNRYGKPTPDYCHFQL